MLMSEPNASVTPADNGMPSNQYKRAVLQPPPSRFSVEFLTPSKSNGSYHHGMHISPALAGDGASTCTRRVVTEYDIWRRWEDCLWFQDTLEKEYTTAARERKTRLQQGKGVKTFNGIYKQDMASSWESLPPGPDPKSVAQDIHGYLPRLTRKGTLFRASQATIDMRQKEFRALIEALFTDEMPSLIQEIRASTIVSDFFGLWRRDYEHMDSLPKGVRSSVTSSVFSTYFSESSSSLSVRSTRTSSSSERSPSSSLPNSPAKRLSRSSAGSTERPRSLTSDITEVTRYPQSKRSSVISVDTISDARIITRPRRRPISSSSDSSSTHSDGSSDSSSASSSTPAIVEDVAIAFGHDPQSSDRQHSILEVLPEERDMLAKSDKSPDYSTSLLRRPRASPSDRRTNRTWSIVEMPSNTSNGTNSSGNTRESWQTADSMDESASEIMAGLSLSLPHPIKDNKYRESLASISTFMTTDSADAVISRRSPTSSCRSSATSTYRTSTAVTLSDFEIYSDYDDADTESMLHRRSILDSSSILDSFPRPNSYLPQSYRNSRVISRPETPTSPCVELPTTPITRDFGQSLLETPPSPTSTISTAYTFSTITSSPTAGSISIKAAHKSGIILLRVSREMSLAEIRQRIYNKFVGQEGIPLAIDFTVAFVLSPQQSAKADRKHLLDDAELRFVSTEADWESIIMTTSSGKVTLRILDPK